MFDMTSAITVQTRNQVASTNTNTNTNNKILKPGQT